MTSVGHTDIVITEEIAVKYRGAGKGGIPRAISKAVVAYNREKTKNERHMKRKKLQQQTRFNKYGITKKDYDVMYKQQLGKCAICGGKLGYSDRGTHIDHNHISNKVRGLLCLTCNTLVVAALESKHVIGAIQYLRTHDDEWFYAFIENLCNLDNQTPSLFST